MKIESISTRVLDLPLQKPYFSGGLGRWIRSVGHVLVEASTSEGHAGIGYSFTLDNRKLPVLKAAIDELKDLAVGEDVFAVKTIWRNMIKNARWFGPGGLMYFAICGIDVALWDLVGQVTGKPLYLLLGGWRDRIPCYYAGFWRSSPTNTLSEEAQIYRAQGYRAVKMRLGGEGNLKAEVERVKVVREALGDDIDLMADANQAWSPRAAIWVGERLKEYDLFWLEDPVAYEDLEGRGVVAEALDIPIASGEDQYTRSGFLHLIEHGAADIFNLDLERVAGITGWLNIAAFLEARNLPFAGHLVPEIQCHLLSTTQKGLTTEYIPWSFDLYKEGPKLEDGYIRLPQGPGIGLEINEEAIRKYEIKQ